VVTASSECLDDHRARYVAVFFGGIRSSCAQPEHYGWTREEADRRLASCARIEQLGLPVEWLVLTLCCAGRTPLNFEEAAETVEAICQSATR
jgi:hypothetical protein